MTHNRAPVERTPYASNEWVGGRESFINHLNRQRLNGEISTEQFAERMQAYDAYHDAEEERENERLAAREPEVQETRRVLTARAFAEAERARAANPNLLNERLTGERTPIERQNREIAAALRAPIPRTPITDEDEPAEDPFAVRAHVSRFLHELAQNQEIPPNSVAQRLAEYDDDPTYHPFEYWRDRFTP
jgi:hypothetical protein